jgi:hypothetical protein
MQHACEKKRNVCIVLEGKTKGRKLVERPRRKWDDNIKMDF